MAQHCLHHPYQRSQSSAVQGSLSPPLLPLPSVPLPSLPPTHSTPPMQKVTDRSWAQDCHQLLPCRVLGAPHCSLCLVFAVSVILSAERHQRSAAQDRHQHPEAERAAHGAAVPGEGQSVSQSGTETGRGHVSEQCTIRGGILKGHRAVCCI